MLDLSSATLIGRGLHRECFEHPDDPSLCVKIVVAGNSDENQREAKYYRQLTRRGISWEMLTRFHGLVETDRGIGAVFDLVRDLNGGVSMPLDHYLALAELSSQLEEQISEAILQLRAYLLENRIVTMTLKPKNIVFQRLTETAGRLVIVDNVGNSDFLPVANYSGFFARRKIKRKWRRFEELTASVGGC